MREEQWLVTCEKDALKRDLERATRRCEQMQSDATLKVVSGACGNNHGIIKTRVEGGQRPKLVPVFRQIQAPMYGNTCYVSNDCLPLLTSACRRSAGRI